MNVGNEAGIGVIFEAHYSLLSETTVNFPDYYSVRDVFVADCTTFIHTTNVLFSIM